jgi:hypothetical protein
MNCPHLSTGISTLRASSWQKIYQYWLSFQERRTKARPLAVKSKEYYILYTEIGQLPIADGLFGPLRSAYFSSLQPGLMSVQPEWGFVVP